ncbi:MAG TPA: DUF819 family protein [Gemmatimonadaceae bacterium]|nr:DUF819 family protein [Gemmatimonadaceae bacterium]
MGDLRTNSLFILAVLSLLVVLSEWLVRRTALRHLGSALLVIVLTAIVANLGVLPTTSSQEAPVPLYDAIFAHVAPIAIFWLLLHVNLRSLLKAGLPLIALFLVGSLGTLAGAVVAMRAVNGAETVGALYGPVTGMFAGTYIGGSVNFNAIALHYDVTRDAVLYGGAVVVDNIVTTIWIMVTLAAPRLFARLWVRRRTDAAGDTVGQVANGPARVAAAPIVELAAEVETIDPMRLALVLALGVGAQWVSILVTGALEAIGVSIPSILVITTLALIIAQIPAVSRLSGPRVLGMYAVYLFLAVIGAFCDVRAMAGLGVLGPVLLAFAMMTVLMHGAIVFGVGRLFRMDLDGVAIASQANVGGSTSALALAKSLGREDLLLPAILLGALGNAIGTFMGFIAVRLV